MPVKYGRVYLFLILSMVWFVVVGERIFHLKVDLKKHYEKILKVQNSYFRLELARRGDILDRNGERLASSEKMYSVYADVKNIENKREVAKYLSEVLSVSFDDIYKRISKKKGFRCLKRFISSDIAQKIRKKKIPGIYLMGEFKREYPKGSLLSHVLGAVKFDKGCEKGLLGLEYEYENYLKGSNGIIFYKRDALSRVLKQVESKKPIPGDTLSLTIDMRLQYITEQALEMGVKRARAKRGTAIVMDPYTGEIISFACYPYFNPGNIRRKDVNALKNFAITDVFEPGSTFKIITLAAAFEKHVFDLNDYLYCGNGKIKLFNCTIRDHHSFENLSVEDILAFSSDVGIIKMALKVGDKTIYDFLKKFGFGEKTGIDLPGESRGLLRDYRLWNNISVAYISMGQGIGVTPLQMVRSYCAIANGGYLVKPHLVRKIFGPDGKVVKVTRIYRKRILNNSTTRKIKEALIQVVEKGTGRRASIDGYWIAGKTGTAEIFDKKSGKYSKEDYFASFVGFAPANNPSFVVGVFLDSPKNGIYGGEVAAPIFREIVKKYFEVLNISPDRNKEFKRNKEKKEKDFKDLIISKNNGGKDEWEIDSKDLKFTETTFMDDDISSNEKVIEFHEKLDPEESVVVCSFIGLRKRECIKKCYESGLTIKELRDVDIFNESVGGGYYENKIIAYRQDPPPGAIVKKGTPCTIYFTSRVLSKENRLTDNRKK